MVDAKARSAATEAAGPPAGGGVQRNQHLGQQQQPEDADGEADGLGRLVNGKDRKGPVRLGEVVGWGGQEDCAAMLARMKASQNSGAI